MKNIIFSLFTPYLLLISINTQANNTELLPQNTTHNSSLINKEKSHETNKTSVKTSNKNDTLKVLSLNIWMEGSQVKGGYEGIVNTIIYTHPDLVALSEINNSHGDFTKKLVKSLHNKGLTYYSYKSKNDAGILSRYPIIHHSNFNRFTKSLVLINNVYVDFYSSHLDYTNAAYYLPRGYDGNTWKELPNGPDTNLDDILKENNNSQRPNSIKLFINNAKSEVKKKHAIILAGDFNEPSWMDWSEQTKDLFDHHGAVVPWTTTTLLKNANYLDSYRVKYTDPVAYPGFTWPADNPGADISKLAWAPKADERDRIDFIFYHSDPRLTVQDAVIIGPSGSIVKGKRVKETSQDKFEQPQGVWPTDHKGVLVTFGLNP
ncbi:endonuclease/exonuclease/phosphatase family protein [Xenorhabdus kozodoii]|uniref:Endonuclease/exonuclease/phosphatase domain-containing protein n=1 Tax=Xenorhabdus kozodoii TaxID=351676 RepID=A0A2D0LFX9_9GAMM|nr:endonuclease/exonuclease/phosphatase family protein [Xenorhabdus kozodoii]PHM74616.1 hypothetical protein Xkoz_00539 [Xenorhabdus kozodoii]